jgi:hypothetical protein
LQRQEASSSPLREVLLQLVNGTLDVVLLNGVQSSNLIAEQAIILHLLVQVEPIKQLVSTPNSWSESNG